MNDTTAYLAYDYARFYDWVYEGVTDDIDFYLQAAAQAGAPLLELACGTGRLTIPVARAGFEITGLDLSPEMLRFAQAKLVQEAPPVQGRTRLLQGDMSHFTLDVPVNLAFIPCSSFFHLHSRQQQESCLACIHRQLNSGGRLIIDLIPAERMANQPVGQTVEISRGHASATGKLTRELNHKLAIDPAAQCVTVEHTYIETEATGTEQRYVFVDRYTWVTEAQMRELLQQAGFTGVELFGSYDRQPFSDASPRMIFSAYKGPAVVADAVVS